MTGWDEKTVTRFFSKIRPVDDPFACLIWTGAIDKETGYGRFKYEGRSVMAYRFAWELMVGEIPGRLQPDHLCRVRACVNWLHLEPVTQRINILRGSAPNAVAIQTGRCKRGHDLNAVRPNSYGRRNCMACQRERRAEARATARLKPAA